MADSTLEAIQNKVRRLTRTPSEAQLSTSDLNEYINTAVLYDFPEELRLFSLRTTLTFYCAPYIDTYENGDGYLPTDFKDIYITLHPPVFIAGYQSWFSQDRSQFFGAYPLVTTITELGTGDGVTTSYSGTLSSIPVLRNQVLFESVSTANGRLAVYDDGSGTLSGDGSGTINYVTGVYSVTFSSAPASGKAVNAQTVPYVAQRPQSLLYFDNKITLRPVPDQPYKIDIEAYKRPTELLSSAQSPELAQWWQYIAYLAARLIFQDRQDTDSVAQLMPELKRQERLVLRRTLVQQSNQRSATIYSESSTLGNWGWWGFFNN